MKINRPKKEVVSYDCMVKGKVYHTETGEYFMFCSSSVNVPTWINIESGTAYGGNSMINYAFKFTLVDAKLVIK